MVVVVVVVVVVVLGAGGIGVVLLVQKWPHGILRAGCVRSKKQRNRNELCYLLVASDGAELLLLSGGSAYTGRVWVAALSGRA